MRPIKTISVWNPKGGQGKSLLAVNLAASAVEMGIIPLVICQDPQGTAMLYHRGGNLPFKVIGSIPQERPNADIVILDHQASDWEVPAAQLLLMPLKPARDQFATYLDASKRAQEKGRDIITVVTDGQAHRASEKATTDYLKARGAFVIPSSGVFSRAAEEYRTIFDSALNKAYKVAERRREITHILGAILLENSETPAQGKERNEDVTV